MRDSAESSHLDVGPAVLQQLYQGLLIDNQWSERAERSFEWVGYRLRQIVSASRSFQEHDLTLTRVSSRVPVIQNVRANEPQVLGVLAKINRCAIGCSYVYDREAKSISSTLGGIVHEATMSFRPKQIMDFIACQLSQCESECDWLAAEVEGDVSQSDLHGAGSRSEPDDILNVLDSIFGSDNGEPSHFRDAFEFEAIEQAARMVPNVATLGGSAEGIALEVPFGTSTCLGRLHGDYIHPRLGRGLGVSLLLDAYPEPDIARLSNMLNTREAQGEHPHQCFGAWGARRHQARPDVFFLGHSWFIPNRMYRQGLALDAAYGIVGRARWANRLLNPGTPESDAWQLLAERTEQLLRSSSPR